MISDVERVNRIVQAVRAVGDPEKSFLEIGCGTGIFSIEAARHFGRVVAVDKDPAILEVAKRAAVRAGVAERIRFLDADVFTLSASDLGGRFDVALAEMMSIWTIEEPQVLAASYARKYLLRAGAILIPDSVTNIAECGNYDFEVGDVELRTPVVEFVSRSAFRLNTTSVVAQSLDLQTVYEPKSKGVIDFRALSNERVNCLRLSSLIHLWRDINFYSTDTLMPTTIVPAVNDLVVKRGQVYQVAFQYNHGSPIADAVFRLME
ncbi:methyltransferase domain-containing protein [Actinoplanes friuliensis]|uniref:RNA methylase-like protein n=1 Tax=Actinoplanes friuliensis DSM 7358 TaxID=1246995 RepID=U5VW58_9ACTN|nr:class I SAM-dependent methyltransferase [Actinoplanes friuliensis]AGZ41064.1 RNA methylase-like protein [Actinoplanes friuliensis DSM 7358]